MEKLAQSVKPYVRHLVALTALPAVTWDRLLQSPTPAQLGFDLHAALQRATTLSRAGNTSNTDSQGATTILRLAETRVTLASLDEAVGADKYVEGDILLFPERVLMRGLTAVDVSKRVIPALATRAPAPWRHCVPSVASPPVWRSTAVSTLGLPSSTVIFVCCHTSRDARCGIHGHTLLRAISSLRSTQLARPDLDAIDRMLWMGLSVFPSSHIGGHEFAGNLIFYPSADWFGLMNDHHQVKELLMSYFAAIRERQENGGVFAELWVARMSAELKRHWRNSCC
jgi:hypothetical protein